EVSLGSVAGAGLGVGIMMPALTRARGQARRVVSASNLKQIAVVLHMYAEDHDGRFPKDMQEAKPYYNDSKILESPHKPNGFDGPSYIYIAGQTTAMEPGNIIAYENPAFSSEGLNVLFMDGHVEWMKTDAFLSALEETYKRLGREMPEIKFKEPNRIVPVEELEPIPVPEEK
ncbi:MAG: DUF1559 domain-containing protein, partial [Planctomycetes bacterium]|nr:DUF1559 domain-containing protein [Planctomycetota bacterium]